MPLKVWKKSCTTWNVQNPVKRPNYQPQLVFSREFWSINSSWFLDLGFSGQQKEQGQQQGHGRCCTCWCVCWSLPFRLILRTKNTERIVSFRFIRRQPAVQPAASAVQPNMLKTRFLAALEVVGFPSIHLSFRRMVLENKDTLAKFKNGGWETTFPLLGR